MKTKSTINIRPLRGAAVRAVGTLGLLVLLGLGRPAAAQDYPSGLRITYPADGATSLSGIVRVEIAIDNALWPGQWSPLCCIFDAENQLVVVGITSDDGLTGWTRYFSYEWDTRLAPPGSTFSIQALEYVPPEVPGEDAMEFLSEAVTVTIADAEDRGQMAAAKIPLHLVSDDVPTHRGSTYPLIGLPAFTVPVTSWQRHGKTYSMAR